MASVFGGFSGFEQMQTIAVYIGWGLLFLVICAALVFGFLFMIVKSKEKIIWELDLVTKRIKKYTGQEKRMKSGKKHIYVGKLKKFLPQIQQKDMYLKGKQDVIFLIKDNNGLHHTARLPDFDEIREWHRVTHGIEIDEEGKIVKDENEKQEVEESQTEPKTFIAKVKNKFKKNVIEDNIAKVMNIIYLMPNPAEDMDWLASQAIEADKEFAPEWWKSPTVLMIGTLALCGFIFIITLIITKKM